MFFIDTTCHCIAYDQFRFDVISHTLNSNLISDIIPNLFDANKSNFSYDVSEVEYFRERMNTKVLTIPNLDGNVSHTKPILTAPIHSIMTTMKDWCDKNQQDGNLKGFVIYGYSYLQYLKFSENLLQNHLFETTCEDYHESLLVYNPTKQLIFLIRIAIGKNLDDQIKFSTNDMTKFVLAFFDVLDKSGVKLINLLVTDEDLVNYHPKCDSCKHQIVSIKYFRSCRSFDAWLGKKEKQFSISVIHQDINRNFSFDLFAKIIAFLNHSLGKPPSEFNSANEQMTGVVILTPEQTKIVYLPCKHLIIQGYYGSGKTIVARKKAEIISRSMTKDDSLYYVICDSRSMLKEELQLCPKISVFHNINQASESAIIDQILASDTKKGKLNLIFDEFYAGTLDEAEAKKLNQEFKTNKRLKDSNVIFVAQPLMIESGVTNNRTQGNVFEMLENMNQPEELTYNMRNTVEVFRLLEATTNALSNHTTTYWDHLKKTKNSKALHDITSEIPNLYEINCLENKVEFQISLVFILRKIMNATETGNKFHISSVDDLIDKQDFKKHVIIHFDFKNDIPTHFNITFKLMGISERVTNKYDEFKRDHKKQIFICSYGTFRGLEHPRVIVVLDTSSYFSRQHLLECLSRSTRFLHIIVLKTLKLVENWEQKDTLQKVVETLKMPFDRKQALANLWEITICYYEKESAKKFEPANSHTSKQIVISIKADICSELKKNIDKVWTNSTKKLEKKSDNLRETESR